MVWFGKDVITEKVLQRVFLDLGHICDGSRTAGLLNPASFAVLLSK